MTAAILLLNVTAVCGALSSTQQVRPALSQEQTAARQEQDAAAHENAEADKAHREAQAQNERELTRATQIREYWVDSSTKLMWAGRDNGLPVTWHKAASYCRNLRLAGYSDWRLATLDELASLVDKGTTCTYRVGNKETCDIQLGNGSPEVRGGLLLTGNPWSSNREINRFGKPYGEGWFFDFVTSKPSGDLPYFRNTKYALCVRRVKE